MQIYTHISTGYLILVQVNSIRYHSYVYVMSYASRYGL